MTNKFKKMFFSEIKFKKNDILLMILGTVMCLIINALLSYIAITLKDKSFMQSGLLKKSTPFYSLIISSVIISPILEEFLFRGILYRTFRKFSSVNVSIFFSALFFALVHGSIYQGIYAFLAGVFFAYVFERFQDIRPSIVIHATINSLVLLYAFIK